jgi:hypothetical protein
MEKKRCYKNEKLKKEKAKETLKGETLVNKILSMKRAEKKVNQLKALKFCTGKRSGCKVLKETEHQNKKK